VIHRTKKDSVGGVTYGVSGDKSIRISSSHL